MHQSLLRGVAITPTRDARIQVGHFGPGNIRTLVQDEPGGEWDITGPPYPSTRAALDSVDDILCYYFGEQPTRGQLAGRIEAALAVVQGNGEARTVAQLQVVIGRMARALGGHADQPRPQAVIDPGDLEVSTTRPDVRRGGLTTGEFDAYVSITHKPTGITVVRDSERSQLMNKAAALNELARLLADRPGQPPVAARNEHPLHYHTAAENAAHPWTDDTLRPHLQIMHGADGLPEDATLPRMLFIHEGLNHGTPPGTPDPCASLGEVRWAPYKEFGIPDPALESFEPPAGPVVIRATGYQREQGTERVVIYWLAAG